VRVLIVSSRFPLPHWRGNQVRTVQWLRALDGATRGLVCPAPEARQQVEGLTPLVEAAHLTSVSTVARGWGGAAGLVAGLPLQEGIYRSAASRRVLGEALRHLEPEVVVVQMVRCAWALAEVRATTPGAGVVFDAIDAMGAHFTRAAAAARPGMSRLLLLEARLCRRREARLVAEAEVSTAVCSRDLNALAPPSGRGRVVPVAAGERRAACPSDGPPTILLSGNLGYRPTVEGAERFARQVWPRLRARLPGVRWILAGARPGVAVRRLADLEGVEVHGDVPDLEPFFARATVAVAPMGAGSGMPMKVVEAWSAGLPVVADPWAAGGLEEDGREAVVEAAHPEEWERRLLELLTDRDLATRIGQQGREVWRRRYRFERVADDIRAAVAAARRTGRL